MKNESFQNVYIIVSLGLFKTSTCHMNMKDKVSVCDGNLRDVLEETKLFIARKLDMRKQLPSALKIDKM